MKNFEEKTDHHLTFDEIYELCPFQKEISKMKLSRMVLQLFPFVKRQRDTKESHNSKKHTLFINLRRTSTPIPYFYHNYLQHQSQHEDEPDMFNCKNNVNQNHIQDMAKKYNYIVIESSNTVKAILPTSTELDGSTLYKEIEVDINEHLAVKVKIGSRSINLKEFGLKETDTITLTALEVIMLQLHDAKICTGFQIKNKKR